MTTLSSIRIRLKQLEELVAQFRKDFDEAVRNLNK